MAGNQMQSSQRRFFDEAGKAAISYIDLTSIQHNREYAGNIYLNLKTGLYYFSELGRRDDEEVPARPKSRAGW